MYKRQGTDRRCFSRISTFVAGPDRHVFRSRFGDEDERRGCLLYTSDAADERSSVDLGGRRIIKKKKNLNTLVRDVYTNTTHNTSHTEVSYDECSTTEAK